MIDHDGAVSSFTSDDCASTLMGSRSFSEKNGKSILWQAMSPSAPVPKSQKPRHLKGTYAGLYGRHGATPSHSSQSSVLGTGGASLGRLMPCGQIGRSVQQCTSRTPPSAPA